LKFSSVRARWVQAEEWHPEQKGMVNKDGTYTLEFPYSDERELLGDILRFGSDVEVLAPNDLPPFAIPLISWKSGLRLI